MTQSERFAEVDSMAEHAQRFAPIVPSCPEPRAPLTMIPTFGHDVAAPKPAKLLKPVESLSVAEMSAEACVVAVRMAMRSAPPREVALMFALSERLLALGVAAVGQPVKLDSAIWLDLKVSA